MIEDVGSEDVGSGVGMGMVDAGVAMAVCSGAAMGEVILVQGG